MNVEAYLDRIGLKQSPELSLKGLSRLQDFHMRHVPFENLDVLLGRPLNLSLPALFDKVVSRQRGGYCFELNSLYAALLTEVGFDPIAMMARVWLRDPSLTPPRTHLLNRVKIDGQDWISDVGFGGRAARLPLKIEDGYEVEDGDGRIRVIADPQFGYRVQRYQENVWSNQYSFETQQAHRSDILIGNHWTETHPESHFRQGIGVGLFTEEGRTSFYGGVLTRRGVETQTETVNGLSDVSQLLSETFGLNLKLSSEEEDRLAAYTTLDQ